ncbi:uncharacterized protein TRAVEDRAFT_111403 [Trametes versicolor FP-101664 SS1]|uniref:uncharacterized protein n=1 Tax=Trametes versicolor (strain FP-101664) TaxID=717944 RepID=UPI00046240B8|nr:uncharacterized protein TRAVEDRAFT_111403 [Trametes versicolor FP-101664 SS1]EIW63953.1 hypothetical protein TRAVEDRAFT_111403 [Trametes versicolor FP-101664 SS1]
MSITTRPSLPTSTSDFALPSSPSTSLPTTSSDDLSPFMLRLRRPSLLGPRPGGLSLSAEARLHSPLVTSFTRRHSSNGTGDDSESDRDKMSTDSDSGNATPLLPGPSIDSESDTSMKTNRPRTPPRLASASSSSSGIDEQMSGMRLPPRRLSKATKMPHIQRLVAESHTQENEVQSEAQFQRMLASFSMHPRTPRAPSDRGRYPEDAAEDETQRESTPSDDEELDESVPFAYTDSAAATKPVTPAQSICGDDPSMLESPIGFAMDVDMPSSSVGSPSISSWRYTPPPTSTSAVRNKRKLDDRYDPYPTAAKRRAVSPSVNHLRMANGAPRLSMPIPIPIPNGIHSGASSPVVQGSSSYFSTRQSFGSASAMSSPTLRAQIGLSSPVLRPMTRARRDGEREVDGAEEGVNGLSIG